MLGSTRLSPRAKQTIYDSRNTIYVSVVTIWEAGIKHRQGRLPEAAVLLNDPRSVLSNLRFIPLSIELKHARFVASIASSHKDPFDRMLAAQAILEGLTLVSRDDIFDTMPVTRLW
jgi:PIN domain nuclease of toxin-antitoxin system